MKTYRNKKEKVKESLIFQIISERLKIGERIPPERMLCELNNVSRITVRAALAELERERIIEKRGRRGIFVCAKPESVKNRGSKSRPLRILYVFFSSLPNGTNTNILAFSSIFHGIGKYVNAQKDIVTLQQGESFMRSSDAEKQSYDGLIVGGVTLDKHLPKILSLNIPVVAVASLIYDVEIDSVTVDFYEGGYVAARKLSMEGSKSLLLLGIKYEHDNFILPNVIAEYRGMKDYCFNNGLKKPLLYNIVTGENPQPALDKDARRKLIRILKKENVDGIICSGGDLRQVIDSLKQEMLNKGGKFPQIAVFNDGVDHMSGQEFIQIYKNLDLCGFCAAEMLYERYRNPNADPIKKLIPVRA